MQKQRNTWGFRSLNALDDHFLWHGVEGGFTSVDEYGAAAQAFLKGEKTDAIDECTRRNGQTVRYHKATQEFGVLSPGGYIVTYYKLTGTGAVNAAYFRRQCQQ